MGVLKSWRRTSGCPLSRCPPKATPSPRNDTDHKLWRLAFPAKRQVTAERASSSCHCHSLQVPRWEGGSCYPQWDVESRRERSKMVALCRKALSWKTWHSLPHIGVQFRINFHVATHFLFLTSSAQVWPICECLSTMQSNESFRPI